MHKFEYIWKMHFKENYEWVCFIIMADVNTQVKKAVEDEIRG